MATSPSVTTRGKKMEDEALLELRNATVTFESRNRKINALDNVSIRIGREDMLAVVGESGAGKTTLVRCLIGLTRPSNGSVIFKGRDIHRRGRKTLKEFRRSVQIIFQDPYGAMNPKHNILQYITMPLKFLTGDMTRMEMETRAEELLGYVGLKDDVLWKYPHQLSGGQKQRIAIGRALASDPEFIIADEPTSMLDASAAAGILNLLKKLADTRKMGYAIVTHNMGVAAYSSRDIYVMYSGKVIEQTETAALVSSPRHPYSKVLLDHAPRTLSSVFAENSKGVNLKGDSGEHDPWAEKGCRYMQLCTRAVERCASEFPPLAGNERGRYACFNPLETELKRGQ